MEAEALPHREMFGSCQIAMVCFEQVDDREGAMLPFDLSEDSPVEARF